jgi:hypothetical protein
VRRLAVAVVLVVCAVCAGASGTHRFAGMTRADAAVQATGVVPAFAPSIDEYQDPRIFRQVQLVEVSPQRDSLGLEAWLAYPEPVSPFGPVAPRFVPGRPRGHGWVESLRHAGEASAPGTSGLEGFVIDERTWRVIPGARIVVAPSTRLSGFWRIAPRRLQGLELTADSRGSFAILTLPARRLGYDFVISARKLSFRLIYRRFAVAWPGEPKIRP